MRAVVRWIATAGGAVVVLAPALARSQSGRSGQAAPTIVGVWEAIRVNGDTLPMTDRVVGTDGFTHAVRLHDMVIRVRADGRFQAALRYRRAVLTRGERIDRVPLQTDTWIGAYTMTGNTVRFVPERRGDQVVQPFDGERTGERITVTFDYEIVTRKTYRVLLHAVR